MDQQGKLKSGSSRGRRGAVAAGHPATIDAAVEVLNAGGNAVDAALAAMCAACIAEPVLASLGGGGFMVVAMQSGPNANRKAACDFFVQTPRQRRPVSDLDFRPVVADFGTTQQMFHIGMGSIATPGLAAGLFEVHRRFGHMPLRDVVAPAIHIARAGAVVTEMQAHIASIVSAIIRADAKTASMFESKTRPGELLAVGEIMVAPDFADFLDVLTLEGPDLFYRGEIAQIVSEACQAHGGYLTRDDFAAYTVNFTQPLHVTGFGADLFSMPAPSLGGLLIAFSLKLLEAEWNAGFSFGNAKHLSNLIGAMRLAEAARTDFSLDDREISDQAARLLAPATLAAFRDMMRARVPVANGTTQISVIDADGNAASLSVSNGEGAAYVVPETGIIMNNMLGEADINPQGFHAWPVGSRMHSMMAPCVAFGREGEILTLGSGGSNRIRSAILQVLANVLAFDMPIEEAVSAPRLHFEGGRTDVEPGFDEPSLAAVRAVTDHVECWSEQSMFFGGVHAVRRRRPQDFEGAGDLRRGGAAVVL
jgi:gamma-glutamyltranspeptidase/glutathione hydrolase